MLPATLELVLRVAARTSTSIFYPIRMRLLSFLGIFCDAEFCGTESLLAGSRTMERRTVSVILESINSMNRDRLRTKDLNLIKTVACCICHQKSLSR